MNQPTPALRPRRRITGMSAMVWGNTEVKGNGRLRRSTINGVTPDMLTLAFGARYVGGVTALRVAALAIPAYSLSGLFEQACLAAGGEATRVRVNVSALVLMTLVCVTLVPRWGAVGAAAALPAGFAFSALVYGVALRSELPRAAMARHAAPALPLALALGAAWFAAHAAHVSAVIALPAGAILSVAAVLALRMLPAELLDRRKPA